MDCGSVMNHPLVTLAETETVEAAAQVMAEGKFGFIAVQGPAGELVGVLTDRDLAVRVCAQNLPADATRVGSVMTTEVISCHRDDSVEVAEALMAQHQKQRIVVLGDGGVPAGVLSLSDLAQCEQPLKVATLLRQVKSREFRYKGSQPPERMP
ncbi:MAG TPA: CBS domain-containing protein [Polyangiaceae bacterium]|nr:CBS domain-containing protein [Polyangiaceae bacterium]